MANILLLESINKSSKWREIMKYRILFILLGIPVILTGCNWMYGQI